MRRPALTARSTCSRPCVSTRPPGSKTRIFRRCGYSAARRPRFSHMLPMIPSISYSESPGKARLMLRRACRVTGRRGPMPRASPPPKADAQSSGKTLNMPNKNAAPQASRRSATLGVLAERLGAGVLALGINCAIQVGIRFRRRRLSRSLFPRYALPRSDPRRDIAAKIVGVPSSAQQRPGRLRRLRHTGIRGSARKLQHNGWHINLYTRAS